MFSILQSVQRFVFRGEAKEESLEEITKQLQEATEEDEQVVQKNAIKSEPFQDEWFYATGVVTLVADDFVIIDKKYTCDKINVLVSHSNLLNKKVQYVAQQQDDNKELEVKKIVSVDEGAWDEGDFGDDEQIEAVKFYKEDREGKKVNLVEKNVVGAVVEREGRKVCIGMASERLWFDLNKVESRFIPLIGDWLKATSFVTVDTKSDDMCGEVLEVKAIEPLRIKVHTGKITGYDPMTKVGHIDNHIIFSRGSFVSGYLPCVKDVVACDAIESNQDRFKWRCLEMVPLSESVDKQNKEKIRMEPQLPPNIKALLEDKNGIVISKATSAMLDVNEEKFLNLTVKNIGNMTQKLTHSCFRSSNSQSQLTLLSPKMNTPIILGPMDSVVYKFSCKAKFVGTSQEVFEFVFQHFSMARIFYVTVKAKGSQGRAVQDGLERGKEKKTFIARNDEYDLETFIPGIRPSRPAAFSVKTGIFRVPKDLWQIVLPLINSKASQLDKEVELEKEMPHLTDNLTFENYKTKFHALLYLEEIDEVVGLQRYDIESVCMKKCGEYLTMEVLGLAEKRPSLICGDRAIVTYKWKSDGKDFKYEGFIHKIKHNEIFLKFNDKFFQSYGGEDCQVTFKSSATVLQRCHQATNDAFFYLGKQFLFPTKVEEKEPQYILRECEEDCDVNDKENIADNRNDANKIDPERYMKMLKTRKLQWFNQKLNKYQKIAVKNVLMGIARPLPYVIFGPPGTGKTITLCETILQIFKVIPDSRILIATPANSSANLIAERLLDSNALRPGDLVRLVAYHYFEDGAIPEKLLPYCAVGNLRSPTDRDTYHNNDPKKKSLTSNVLGRHRITIGTCSALGILYNMGFPKGHFTHVVVDEAGQATEPEIMITLTFIRPDSGQVVLAGDPMQLGPMIQSKLASHFGLGESFLWRLLQTFPYQRDPQGFETGYDPRLVTKLLMNYRSLPEILSLPNKLFYDSELQPQVSNEFSNEAKILKSLEEILPTREGLPPAIVFHGVIGSNHQDTESPSWYNQEEATQVYLYFLKLIEKGIAPEDIGIITPYRKQVSQIRDLLLDLDMDMPKVGSVEEFQGQERKVILLSTVRSSRSLVVQDLKHMLGFVKSPQRLNVAITRARALIIIIGNPLLLSCDHSWRSVIDYCYLRQGYTGCNMACDEIVSNEEESLE